MNGFLVVIRMTLDDIPWRFFSDLDEAMGFIDEITVDGELTVTSHLKLKALATSIDFNTSALVRCDVLKVVDGFVVEVAYSRSLSNAG
jgi:hypothetical protein